MSSTLSKLILLKLQQVRVLLLLTALVLVAGRSFKEFTPKWFNAEWVEPGCILLACFLTFAAFGLIDDVSAEIHWKNKKLDE